MDRLSGCGRPVLRGRDVECRQLDQVVDAVRGGESRALVVRGEAGIGKSAVLDYLVANAARCTVVRVCGIQAEAGLAFAGLHQLCAPLLDRLDRVPPPQREALCVALGLRAGSSPDPFLLGLAVLSVLSEAASERPLICAIDDAQWLDQPSAHTLGFVARRLAAESVALVVALREPAKEQPFAGLPQLALGGLRPEHARELLAVAIPGPLDERVRDRIVSETRGNPLALLELPRGLPYVELAGGFGLPGARVLSDSIEDSVRRRLATLPSDTRRLLLVAAVESTGDPSVVCRAAALLGIDVDDRDLGGSAGLLHWGRLVTFRHSLARSAVYRAASAEQRREAHRALAGAIDRSVDADRRAWHLAHATTGHDEGVAAELERSAVQAQARGGLAATGAFLERAALLTLDRAERVRRTLTAAQTRLQVGAFSSALGLLSAAEAEPLTELQRARIDLLRAEVAFASRRGTEALPLLLAAADRLAPLDARLARDTYLDALSAGLLAGRLAGGGVLSQVARAARRAPEQAEPPKPPKGDLVLDALSTLFTDGYAAALPRSRQAVRAFRTGPLSVDDGPSLRLASALAADSWDDEGWQLLATRHVQVARDAGALGELLLALNSRIVVHLFAGELAAAAVLVDEAAALAQSLGHTVLPYGAVQFAAWRGRAAEASTLIQAGLNDASAHGEGIGVTVAHCAAAVLANGSCQYGNALISAEQASACPLELGVSNWGLTELVEAAARVGRTELAAEALRQLSAMTSASGTDWALGIEARSRALLSDDDAAEPLYREAIERLGRTRVRAELARARLLYGEWLRRAGRRRDARDQLRLAREMFAAMGADAFAERAGGELTATGETARKRSITVNTQLTAREAQIARLAHDGLSNPQIGARLFLSPRTVEYHLGNVFAKLNISSRHELATAFPADDQPKIRVSANASRAA